MLHHASYFRSVTTDVPKHLNPGQEKEWRRHREEPGARTERLRRERKEKRYLTGSSYHFLIKEGKKKIPFS